MSAAAASLSSLWQGHGHSIQQVRSCVGAGWLEASAPWLGDGDGEEEVKAAFSLLAQNSSPLSGSFFLTPVRELSAGRSGGGTGAASSYPVMM